MPISHDDALRMVEFSEMIARLETWQERQRRQSIQEGAKTEADIESDLESSQKDLDYLEGQDEALENLIRVARDITGITPDLHVIPDTGPEIE